MLLSVIEEITNAYLKLDPENSKRLQTLNGRKLGLIITGINLQMCLHFKDTHIHFEPLNSEIPQQQILDVKVEASPLDLLSYTLWTHNDPNPFAQQFSVTGSTHVLQDISDFFKNVEIDWEEYLSNWLGDNLAHSLCQSCKQIQSWQKNVVQTLKYNLLEYLQEEAKDLPPSAAVRHFYDEIQTLSFDVDRLQARFKKFTNSMAGNNS